ncbi:RUN and FYVE domain-containing protein 4 [Lissotriton helveticus]
MAGNGEIIRIIQDLKNLIRELNTNYRERNLPVTDGSPELHSLCVKLEYLLQCDLKEKKSFFGTKRDYWDFFSFRFSRIKGGHKGIEFVNSVTELKTSTGRGRSFIRYCLANQQLAESIQLGFMEIGIAREWYYARNPFLNQSISSNIISQLYELNGITFNLGLKRGDLEAAWPVVPGRFREPITKTTINEEKAPASQTEDAEKGIENGQETQRTQPQKVSTSVFNGDRTLDYLSSSDGVSESTKKEHRENAEEPSSELSAASHVTHQKIRLASSGNFQYASSLLDDLIASGQREVDLQRFNSELQGQIEEMEKEHKGHVTALQEMVDAQKAKEDERQRLLEELERDKKKHQEQLEEQARHVQELQDNKSFLSETLEELDVLVNDLRQKLSAKESEGKQRTEAEAQLKAAFAEAHEEELANLAKRHKEMKEQLEKSKQEITDELNQVKAALESKEHEMNEIISEHHQSTREMVALAKSLEHLAEKCKVLEAEKRKNVLDSETQEFRYQQLQSQCIGAQEKLSKSQQKVEEQEELLTSLQTKLTQSPDSEKQMTNIDGEDDKESNLAEEQRCFEEELRNCPTQREKLEKKLELCSMEKAELEEEIKSLSETLLCHKQDLCSARLDIKDLSTQLISYQDEIASLKNNLDSKENALRCKEKDITLLQSSLEDTTTHLKQVLSEKSATDTQLVKLKQELAVLVEEKAKMQGQAAESVIKREEALNELKSRFASLEEQMLKKEDEAAKAEGLLKTTLQSISEEKDVLDQQLQSTRALLEEQTTTATQLKMKVEELQSSANDEKEKLGEKLTNLQAELDALEQQRKEAKERKLAQNEEVVQHKYQIKKLELEKLQVTDLLKKSRDALEHVSQQMSSAVSENAVLKEKYKAMASELDQQRERGQNIDKFPELTRLQKENVTLREKLLAMKGLEKVNKALHERLKVMGSQTPYVAGSLNTEEGDLMLVTKNGPRHTEKEHLENANRDCDQRLSAKENEVKNLEEQVLRAKQDQESMKSALEKERSEANEREEMYKAKLAEQKEMVKNMKERVLKLLQEKDALWKKTEGLTLEQQVMAASDPNTCKTCKKDFKLLSKKYQCRSCNDTICSGCAVKSGKKERYCSQCHQQRSSLQVT